MTTTSTSSPRLRSARRLVIPIVALAVAAGACSTSDASDATAPEPVTDSAAPPTTTVAPTTPTVDDFCAVAREWVATLPRNAAGRPQGPASPDPADVATYFRTNAEYLDRLAGLAPGVTPEEVTEALARLDDASTALLAELEAAGILHRDPARLAEEAARLKRSPEAWLARPEHRAAAARFCREYARTDDDWRRSWKDFLAGLT